MTGQQPLGQSSPPAAVRLADGRVLVLGGRGPGGDVLASAELYDPATDRWTAVASMREGRESATATLVDGGRVVVVGGIGRREVAAYRLRRSLRSANPQLE